MIKEMFIGMGTPSAPSIAQTPYKEKTWQAIHAYSGVVPPPPETAFPWWLVGVVGVTVVGIVTAKELRKGEGR